MNGFKTKDILTGVIIIIVIIVGILAYSKFKKDKTPKIELNNTSTSEKIIDKFNVADSLEKVELKNISGGQGGGVIINSTLLTDLPDPQSNSFYQVWTNENGEYVSLGKMKLSKGGYLFENIPDGKKIVVSLEQVLDNKLETKILE